jgi:hypothetical protein
VTVVTALAVKGVFNFMFFASGKVFMLAGIGSTFRLTPTGLT